MAKSLLCKSIGEKGICEYYAILLLIIFMQVIPFQLTHSLQVREHLKNVDLNNFHLDISNMATNGGLEEMEKKYKTGGIKNE